MVFRIKLSLQNKYFKNSLQNLLNLYAFMTLYFPVYFYTNWNMVNYIDKNIFI